MGKSSAGQVYYGPKKSQAVDITINLLVNFHPGEFLEAPKDNLYISRVDLVHTWHSQQAFTWTNGPDSVAPSFRPSLLLSPLRRNRTGSSEAFLLPLPLENKPPTLSWKVSLSVQDRCRFEWRKKKWSFSIKTTRSNTLCVSCRRSSTHRVQDTLDEIRTGKV